VKDIIEDETPTTIKRHINKHAKEVYTKLAYAIGQEEPVMAVAVIDGQESEISGYDLTPRGIHEYLKLDQVKFRDTCTWGHFGRGFEWE